MKQQVETRAIFVQILKFPKRKAIIKRGIKAKDYHQYVEEVGCKVWEQLCDMKGVLYEPVQMWLPYKYCTLGQSNCVQGVEVREEYTGRIPDGFEVLDLPACEMMVFQGEPFDESQEECLAQGLWDVIQTFNTELYGYMWDDENAPRIQLEPRGYRGHMEARPVRQIDSCDWWKTERE